MVSTQLEHRGPLFAPFTQPGCSLSRDYHQPAGHVLAWHHVHVAMQAGYSGTPLPRKLGVKDDDVVLLDKRPPDVELGDLGGAHVVSRLRAGLDVTLTFHTTYATLVTRLPALFDRTVTDGMVWVCWPKKAAHRHLVARGVTVDLDENVVRDLALGLGWVDVKVAAVDETWSGLKLVRRLRDR